MRAKMICTLATALIVSATAAFGAVKAGSFSVTPLIGGYFYDDDQSRDYKDPALVLGARAGYNFTKAIGIEALYDYVDSTKSPSGSSFSLHRFGGQLLYHFFPDKVIVPYLTAGFSGISFDGNGLSSKSRGAFDYGAGVKYFLTDNIALRGEIKGIVYDYNAISYGNAEFLLGAYIQFGGTTPTAKAVATEPEPAKEVAAPVSEHEPASAVVATAPIPPADSDGDGVIDTLDKCPGTPSGVAVDDNGCPVDTDKDGIPDFLDKCPGTQAGVTVDSNGCPIGSAIPASTEIQLDTIYFDFDKSDLRQDARDVLSNNAATILKSLAEAKIRIEGHCDERGSVEYNLALGERRAKSAQKYLTTLGVKTENLSVFSYGEERPAVNGSDEAAWAKNRRAEFVIIK